MSPLRPFLLLLLLLGSSAWAAPEPAHQVTITSPSSGALNELKINVTVSFATDASGKGGGNIQTIELLVNGTVTATYNNPPSVKSGTATFTGVDLSAFLNSGSAVTLVARAFQGDAKANQYVDSAPVSLLIDALPPVISNLSPASGSFSNAPQPTLLATVTDTGGSGVNASSIVLKLQGAVVPGTVTLVNPNTATVAYAIVQPLAQGTYTFTVDAKDNAGNTAATASSTWLVDLTPPVISGLLPQAGGFLNTSTPTVSATVTDTGGSGVDSGSIQVKIDGAPAQAAVTIQSQNTAVVSAAPAVALGQGSHTVTVDAKDRAGNAAPTASSTFLVDLTPPVVTMTGPAAGSFTGSAKPALAAVLSDAGGSGLDPSTLLVTLDGAPVTATLTLSDPNTASLSFVPAAPLAEGPHRYSVSIHDRAGNASATATSTFTIDLTPPALALSPASGVRVQGPTVSVSATYSDALSGVNLSTLKVTLDGADITSKMTVGASQATLAATMPLADGPHTLAAQIADQVGNLAQATSVFQSDSGLGTVGAQGGTVSVSTPSLPSFGASLGVPPGALTQNVTFFINAVTSPPAFPSGYTSVGPILDFGPSTVFAQPVTIEIPYNPQLLTTLDVSPMGLRLLTYNAATGTWTLVPVLSVDTSNHLLEAQITELVGQMFGAAAPIVSPSNTLEGVPSTAAVADGLSFTTLTITPEAADGSILGPGQTVTATVAGVGSPSVQIQDLGNGVYQIFISSTLSGTASVTVSVDGVALPTQTVQFTPMPVSFAISGFTSPLTAGGASSIQLTALDQSNNPLTSFTGSVEIDLTGTRDSGGNLIYPDSFVATFTSSNAGVITLPSALVFAQAGTQQIKVLYILGPSITGSARVQVLAGAPAVLTKVAGDGQSGAAGTTLPQPLSVRLTDLFGNPVSGTQVRFAVQSGSASFVQ